MKLPGADDSIFTTNRSKPPHHNAAFSREQLASILRTAILTARSRAVTHRGGFGALVQKSAALGAAQDSTIGGEWRNVSAIGKEEDPEPWTRK
jgi:hypothetical protein